MNEQATATQEITQLLTRPDMSDREKNNQLLGLVYSELKNMARQKMFSERANHTLTPTALVHEAYMRLVKNPDLHWQSRRHFFAAAAESMRRILIDSARSKASYKKGANAYHTSNLDISVDNGKAGTTDILDLDRALHALEAKDEIMSQVVKLRYFAGLTAEETALALDMSLRTTNRVWAAARAWLIVKM
ncbi:ECF-type sigma factor [Marinicella sp. W31]|uniref:ECF-type sigma factor n=1 Tax=Marinicella sp. W31 TaxID=3023713 RepID=UPI003757393C